MKRPCGVCSKPAAPKPPQSAAARRLVMDAAYQMAELNRVLKRTQRRP